ncbi:putative mitochondrial protein [Trifolium repens]|nr:putative mitochondrial protein [Trifolium repens]
MENTSNLHFVQPAIPKFDGYYEHWSMLMENLLRSKEYWNLIENGVVVAPANATPEQRRAADDSKLRDLKVKNYLFQAIDRSILETILTRDTSRDIWEAMRRKYQGSTKVKRAQLQSLRREFEVLAMGEGESVNDYFARTLSIANKMTAQGERIEQVMVVEKILRSMPAKFNYVVCSIEESNDVTTLSIDELQSSLLVHEQRMKGQQEHSDEHALKVSHAGRGRGRSTSRGRGRGRQSKEFVECYKCHKLGHYKNECPDWEGNANYVEQEYEEEMLLMAHSDLNEDFVKEPWYLDSGCSNHMIGSKDCLFDFDETFRESVKLGNDSKMAVMGKGNVKLNVKGRIHVITDVYYLPGLRNNLLSIGQLQQKGLTIVFRNNMCQLFHDEKGLILNTEMTANRMYIVTASVIMPKCLQVSKIDEARLWHQRYAHLSFKGLRVLNKKEMVKGLPVLNELEDKCEDCLSGKQHRETIPKQANWRASQKLELVHSDVCGPINPQSNGGNRYFITFTDDFSRKTWVYFLQDKACVFEIFKKFKTLVENESGCIMQCLRTDRGGEFTSTAFNDFCNVNGVKRQLTAAYTPQQNGVSERKNRTLLNMVRSMITARDVPKKFWPEAVKWAAYVMNRCPTFAVRDMTPEEAWSGRKPSVHHFRVFGCLAHVHVPDVHRKKLDGKSIKCVLLGVSEESKAYKLYEPVGKRIIVSRDVIFEESKSWNWCKKGSNKAVEIISESDDDNENNVEVGDNDEGNDDHGNDATSQHTNNSSGNETDGAEDDALPARDRRPPAYLRDYVTNLENNDDQVQNLAIALFSSSEDPSTYEEAAKVDSWRKAMDSEIQSIEDNDTWELVNLPPGVKAIGVKWIFKTKYNEKGQIEKHKARLVAKGYSQKYGIDYSEVFAPVARWETIRSILSLAAYEGWCVFQLDVKSAFLHGELVENVYVEQPLGYKKGNDSQVYKLKKALYGLRQAPRAWYSKIEAYFLNEKFEKCFCEHTLFVKVDDKGKILIVSVYVDDLIYTGNDEHMMRNFKRSMREMFAMTDLGKMKYFLGIEVIQNKQGIFINQQKYGSEILQRFGMSDCNGVCSPIVPGCKLVKDEAGKAIDATMYKQMIGCLMYMLATRPDMAYSVCLTARYMERPTEMHVAAVKRILRYLKGTLDHGILYKPKTGDELILEGWSDSDYAGDYDDRKSTSGYVFTINGVAVSWCSKKQPIVTLSTTEAEFVSAASCACQCIWLRNVLKHLHVKQAGCTFINCDNSSSIKLSKNPILHGRCKHIDVRYYFLRDLCKDGVIELKYCKTQDQIADIMTKALKIESFCKLREGMGVCSIISTK